MERPKQAGTLLRELSPVNELDYLLMSSGTECKDALTLAKENQYLNKLKADLEWV